MRFSASKTLAAHLLRGLIAFSALTWALLHQENIPASLLAFVVAVVAFRGCPMCWSIGLVETLMHWRRGQDRITLMADDRPPEHGD